jgi:hypothetical protein
LTKASAPSGSYCGPATPNSPFESLGLGWSDFARHYFRNHGCFLFLQVLRWFTSLSLLDHPMYSDERNRCSHRLGFPIRKSPDHRLIASSRGLSQLSTSFIASLRQGIHTHALSSLTIKSISNTKYSMSFFLRAASPPATRHVTFGKLANTCSKYCPSNIQFSKIRLLRDAAFYCKPRRRRKSVFPVQRNNHLRFLRWLWWAWIDSNYRPHPYQGCALAT